MGLRIRILPLFWRLLWTCLGGGDGTLCSWVLPEFGTVGLHFYLILYIYSEVLENFFFFLKKNNIQTAAIWRCMNMAEAENEVDDPGALAAVGCLHAISTILESVSSRLPHLFVQVEPTLVPIMHKMLTSDGQGMYSNTSICLIFDIVSIVS